MHEKTRETLKQEFIKSVSEVIIFTDPAPKPGSGIVKVFKALKDDVKEFFIHTKLILG